METRLLTLLILAVLKPFQPNFASSALVLLRHFTRPFLFCLTGLAFPLGVLLSVFGRTLKHLSVSPRPLCEVHFHSPSNAPSSRTLQQNTTPLFQPSTRLPAFTAAGPTSPEHPPFVYIQLWHLFTAYRVIVFLKRVLLRHVIDGRSVALWSSKLQARNQARGHSSRAAPEPRLTDALIMNSVRQTDTQASLESLNQSTLGEKKGAEVSKPREHQLAFVLW